MAGRAGPPRCPATPVPHAGPTWLTVLRTWRPRAPRQAAVVAARLIAVAGLSIDAYVHLDLASTYSEGQAVINEGVLFRGEAALVLLAGLALLTSQRRRAFVLGFGVSASAFTVMLVSRYVDLGAWPIGAFPDLYDPVWFPEKLWAAGGEAAAAACATGILILSSRMRRRRDTGQQRGHPRTGAAGGWAPEDERGRDCWRINHQPPALKTRKDPRHDHHSPS
jgi:hypothetical protein